MLQHVLRTVGMALRMMMMMMMMTMMMMMMMLKMLIIVFSRVKVGNGMYLSDIQQLSSELLQLTVGNVY
jgi:hypothetical protein